MPGSACGEGIAVPGVEDAVDIFLGCDRVASVEIHRHPQGFVGGHSLGEVDVQGAGEAVQGDGGVHVILAAGGDGDAEHMGVDAAVGAGAARDVAGVAEKGFCSLVECLLDGISVLLSLIAAEGAAVVTDI